MASSDFTSDETARIASVIARAWADPDLEALYRKAPDAVLAGAGIELSGRDAPALPARPDIGVVGEAGTERASFSSASSASTVSCPCSAFTASCANCASAEARSALTAVPTDQLLKLAEDPSGREAARKMTSTWNIDVRSSAS